MGDPIIPVPATLRALPVDLELRELVSRLASATSSVGEYAELPYQRDLLEAAAVNLSAVVEHLDAASPATPEDIPPWT